MGCEPEPPSDSKTPTWEELYARTSATVSDRWVDVATPESTITYETFGSEDELSTTTSWQDALAEQTHQIAAVAQVIRSFPTIVGEDFPLLVLDLSTGGGIGGLAVDRALLELGRPTQFTYVVRRAEGFPAGVVTALVSEMCDGRVRTVELDADTRIPDDVMAESSQGLMIMAGVFDSPAITRTNLHAMANDHLADLVWAPTDNADWLSETFPSRHLLILGSPAENVAAVDLFVRLLEAEPPEIGIFPVVDPHKPSLSSGYEPTNIGNFAGHSHTSYTADGVVSVGEEGSAQHRFLYRLWYVFPEGH